MMRQNCFIIFVYYNTIINLSNVIIENKEKLVNYVRKFKEDVDQNIIIFSMKKKT